MGCPCDWVIDARYRFWYVLGTVIPHCVIVSVTCSFTILSTCHVHANTDRPVNANTTLIQHVLTLSAVHQWVGYLIIARRAILIAQGI